MVDRGGRSQRQRIAPAALVWIASAVVALVACTGPSTTGAPNDDPANGTTATSATDPDRTESGTAPQPATTPGTTRSRANDRPDQLTVVAEGELTPSEQCRPVPAAPSALRAPPDPSTYLPPGARLVPGTPSVSTLHWQSWHLASNGFVAIDRPAVRATAALLLPESCEPVAATGRADSYVAIFCDPLLTEAAERCALQVLDLASGAIVAGWALPDHNRTSDPSSPSDLPIALVGSSDTSPATAQVVEPASGRWREVALPCGATTARVVAGDGADAGGALEVLCQEGSLRPRFDLATLTRDPAAVSDGLEALCTSASGSVHFSRDGEVSRWRSVDANGDDLASFEPEETAVDVSCAIDGDLVALSYVTMTEAFVELRTRSDLAPQGVVTWRPPGISRSPWPAAVAVQALDGRRVWLVAMANVGYLDL